ncbi:MAG: arylesterase [Balneolaceae bacterium]
MFSQFLTLNQEILSIYNKKCLLRVGLLLFSVLFSGFMTEPVWAQDEERNEEEPRTVLIFGDSITAGQGVDMDEAFPALLQDKVDSLGWNVEFVNAGLSGETTAGGVRRIDWVLQRKVDLFVLELGGNDGLRGIEPEVTRRNLQEIMDKVHSKYPETTIILTGMEAPPNMGPRYTTRFREIFQELAHQNEVIFMPFILEGVGGNPELNQSDGIHPTAEGHRKIAENLWSYLKPVLEKDAL